MPECDICHTPLEQRGTRTFCPACLLRAMLGDEDEPEAGVDVEAETVITPVPPSGAMPRLPRYSMIEKLGEGGFANVYRALQREPVRREVAVKVLKPNVANYHVLARFETERQTLARMEHPGIARLWDSGVTMHGQPFFAMELVRGEPVTAYCTRHGLDLRERLEIFISICDAVQHAHEKGVLHRDLKPSNILVAGIGSEREVKIIDFGIAKALELAPETEEDHRMTSIHQSVGTPGYMSPEQSARGAHHVDARSDLYALGVVLYELITGFTPLQIERRANTDAGDRLSAHHVTPPSRLPQTLLLTKTQKRDLDAITLKALETDSAHRYASAAAFAEDVQHHLHDEPVQAGVKSWTYVMEKFTRRHKSFVISSAVALLAVAGGFTTSTILYFREQHARAQAENAQLVVQAREMELRRTLSRADFATAQRFKQDGDYQSTVACLTRSLRHDPLFSPAAVDLEMMLTNEDSPQPVKAAIPIDPAWGEVINGAVAANGQALAVLFKSAQGQRLMLFQHDEKDWRQQELTSKAPVEQIAIAPSGNTLAYADAEQTVTVVTLNEKAADLTWKAPQPVTALVVSTKSGLTAVGCKDGSVWYLDRKNATPSSFVGRVTGSVTLLNMNQKERWIIAASSTGEVMRLDSSLANFHKLLLKMPGAVSAMAVTSSPGVVVAGDALGNVACHREDGLKELPPTQLHQGVVTAISFAGNAATTLITAGGARDLRVRWFDLASGKNARNPLESAGVVRRILVSRSGDEAILVNADSSVRIWRPGVNTAHTLRKPQRARYVAMSTAGRCMALHRDLGRALEVLILSQHLSLGTVLHPGGPPVWEGQDADAAAFAPDGHTLLVTDDFGQALLWDAAHAKLLGRKTWKQPAMSLWQPAEGPMLGTLKDGSLIEAAPDGSEAALRVPPAPEATWEASAISPDGQAAAWGTLAPEALISCRVRVWWAAGNRFQELKADRLSCLAVHGGTQTIALGLGNGHVRVIKAGEERGFVEPLHQSRITSLSFSPDGRALITASTDGTTAVWDAKTLTPLTEAFRLGESVLKTTFSGNGRRFACATKNQVVVGDLDGRALLGQPFHLRSLGGALVLNHKGTRVAYTISSGEVFVHDIAPPPESPAPEWFLKLADTYVARRFTAQGVIETTEHPGLAALRQYVPTGGTQDPWSSYAQWLFTHTGQRRLTPWSELTLEQYIREISTRPGASTEVEKRRLQPFRLRSAELER